MKNQWKNIITVVFLLSGIVGLYFVLKQYSLKEIFLVYRNFNPLILFFYIVVLILLMLTLTWRWDIVIRSRRLNIPFNKVVIYRIIGAAINFLTPGPRVGGEPTQASLMTKHNIEFTEGLSTIMIDKIIDVTTSGILFMIGVFMIGLKYSLPQNSLAVLLVAAFAFASLIATFYYRMLTGRHFFLNIFRMLKLDRFRLLKKTEEYVEKIEQMMIEFYKHNKKAFMKSLAVSVLSWVLMFIEYKLATTLLGINVGIPEIFFIVSFVGMALLFPIPMAIGVLEVGQLSAFALIGLGANAGIALAFLIRAKDIIWSIIGLVLLVIHGFHVGKVVKKGYGINGSDNIQHKR